MEEGTVIELGIEPQVQVESNLESNDDAYMIPDEDKGPETTAARLPELPSWLPCGSIWLNAVPVILLLFLWLVYPVILILICIILLLWLLN